MRRLSLVNLAAALAIAAVGLYAYGFIRVHRHQISSSSSSWTDANGGVHYSETRAFHSTVSHPHRGWAYVAWALALVICLMSVQALRITRRRAAPASATSGDLSRP